MSEAAIQITNGQKPLADVEKELWNIHQGIFSVLGMLRMASQYAEADALESQTCADIMEVLDTYIPFVDDLRIRLDSAIFQLK